MTITTKRKALTSAWANVVDHVETAIGRFHSDAEPPNDCQVVFFEIPRDRHLHVNVIHENPTTAERGWAGPASIAEGFVHNRTFTYAQAGQIVRQVRNVVFTGGM